MKILRGRRSFLEHPVRALSGLGVACACCFLPLPSVPAANAPAHDHVFRGTNLLQISLTIPEAGIEALRHSRRRNEPKPKAIACLTEGGRTYSNVTVQLKGFTSFQPIDGTPGLTLNFDRITPRQKFHGLTKISLNNSLQDPTRLHEKLARELFAAAGVPVPQADHALVTLNGRKLGLYVLAEGFDQTFLGRHFTCTDGNLYEGGVIQDIDQPLRLNGGKDPANYAAVHRLIRAAREPDPDRRWRELAAALDLDRFLSMIAMETMLCHSDSYSMNRNNYRLYHDPATDRIVFLPHGMDRLLGTHRSPLDLPIVPPSNGMVAKAILSTPEGRRRYVDRFGVLFTNFFQPRLLCRRVHEIEAKILVAKRTHPGAYLSFGDGAVSDISRDAEGLCARIAARAAEVKLQLARLPDLVALTPTPSFDANGVADLPGWKPTAGSTGVSCELVVKEGKQLLRVRTTEKSLRASLSSRVSFPAGNYLLTGGLQLAGGAETPRAIPGAVVRYSTPRFGISRRPVTWQKIDLAFQVSETAAPEEIEFICELRGDSPEEWLDLSTLRLIRGR